MTLDPVKIIREKLDENKMSVRQLALKIGASYPALNKSLTGKSGMNLDTFLKIADELGLDIVKTGSSSPVSDVLKEVEVLREDNENLKSLTQFLRKENEELKARLNL